MTAATTTTKTMMTWLYHVLLVLFLLLGSVLAEERFIEQPDDATVTQGQLHVMKCSIDGLVGEVQWLRDGFGLGPGFEFDGFPRYRVQHNAELGEFHLMISDVQLEDDAVFECQVGATAATTGLMSHKAQLTVQAPPESVVIADGASTVEVVADQRYALLCRATGGKPGANITWYSPVHQILLPDESTTIEHVVTRHADDKKEDSLSRLSLIPSRSDEGREIVCQALNEAMMEAISTSIRLRVLYKPEVQIAVLPSADVKEHDDVTLSCSAIANPELVSWKWYSGGVEIPGESGSTFTMKTISYAMNRKQVSCEATNDIGSKLSSITLDVKYGPMFASDPESQPAEIGDSVILSCDIRGNPAPAIYWRRQGNDRILGTHKSLRIASVTEADFTSFTCSASSVGYETVSRNVYVLRKGPPTILSTVHQSARYGERATIECLVKSIPPPTEIVWTKNGRDIDFSIMPRYRIQTEMVSYGMRSVIHIEVVQDSDFAAYNCSARNDFGMRQLAISFTKKEVVPLPYILAGVAAGVLFIVIICIVVVVYRRQKSHLPSESASHRSDDSVDMKKSNHVQSDIKVEYSNNTVDDWHQDMILPPRYPPLSDYDDLGYPIKDPVVVDPIRYETNSYRPHHPDHPDSYAYNQHSDPYRIHLPVTTDIYGTYPRKTAYPYEHRMPGDLGDLGYESTYKGDIYATVGRSKPRGDYSGWPAPPPPAPHSASPTDSRLSTNV